MSKPEQIEKAELWISYILRWGVIACALVIGAGWMLGSKPTIMSGLLMLIGLPIARVLAAALLFLKQKDFVFVGLSTFVLIVLIGSLLLGKKL